MSQPVQASQASQSSQMGRPTFLNMPPQPQSNPDTPSEMPGTPTSTTTSLSALSTTAIKDGHRGHAHPTAGHRGHHHNLSTNSLEAERADRISRLTGLGNVSTLRVRHGHGPNGPQQDAASQATPTSSSAAAAIAQASAAGLTPAYFDASGQPVAATKMSTVGTASATESLGAETLGGDGEDHEMGDADGDEDMLSMDTNYRETEMDSASGYLGTGPPDIDPMDEDLSTRSVSGFEDRMSDDGSASLVGFGEGASSTVSGPIYHRRPMPGPGGAAGSSAGAMGGVWTLERSSSGLSEGGILARREREREREGGETPVSMAAAMERREARMVDGVATDGAGIGTAPAGGDDVYVDTTTRGPVPVQPVTSAMRETQQPHHHHHQQMYQQQLQHQQSQQQGHQQGSTSREAAERMVRERLDAGEARAGSVALGSPGKGNERLGRFYFEERK